VGRREALRDPRVVLGFALALACAGGTGVESIERVREALASVRFVAYAPRTGSGHATLAALRDDLSLLRPHFDGLVTYASARGQDAIPVVAAQLGFRAIVIGVWDPRDARELERAIAAAGDNPAVVVALCIGNEGLFFERYSVDDLRAAFTRARAALPSVALTTSEPFALYLRDGPVADFLNGQDLVLPNVHPLHEPWFASAPPGAAIDFVVNVLDELARRSRAPILVKETGLPSGPVERGFSEAGQAAFWRALGERVPRTRSRAVVFFEAFDAPWKPAEVRAVTGRDHPEEAHFGLLRADGAPKPALAAIALD
jgi:exo-beta-1,3-glucanase (GH17 family)